MLAQRKKPKKKYRDKLRLRPQSELIIALDDLEFSWFPEEAALVQKMWEAGLHIADIAEKVDRDDPDEVALLIMHFARQGKIQLRKSGVFGDLNSLQELIETSEEFKKALDLTDDEILKYAGEA
jgi:hypothetical protein